MTMPNPAPCPITDTELLAYRDGELAAARQAAVGAHIADCPSCQARLAESDLVTRTLTLGSPLRDQPVARAALQERLAADRGGWWRYRALLGAALPVAVLVLVVIGFNRWLRDDDCANCPPQPPPMQVTVFTGIPAGWSSLLPCPMGPVANRLTVPSQRTGANARPRSAAAANERARQLVRAPASRHPSQSGARAPAHQRATARNDACGAANVARQSRPSHWPELGVIWSPVRPGS
jgi:hypothetical protein